MEYGSIERELHIDASPEVVFEVISSPDHLREWFPDDTDVEAVAGATGAFVWHDQDGGEDTVQPVTVVEAEPPRLFSFRWLAAEGEAPSATNSLLVTFELSPSGAGTVLKMTEVGFREKGWEAAVLEEQYNEHCVGWDTHLGRLGTYIARLVATP